MCCPGAERSATSSPLLCLFAAPCSGTSTLSAAGLRRCVCVCERETGRTDPAETKLITHSAYRSQRQSHRSPCVVCVSTRAHSAQENNRAETDHAVALLISNDQNKRGGKCFHCIHFGCTTLRVEPTEPICLDKPTCACLCRSCARDESAPPPAVQPSNFASCPANRPQPQRCAASRIRFRPAEM